MESNLIEGQKKPLLVAHLDLAKYILAVCRLSSEMLRKKNQDFYVR